MAKQPTTPRQPKTWTIYKVADYGFGTRWLGTIEAPDKQIAIDKGAHEFKVDAWRLYAVQRR
jgi:hypothetical protein